MGVLQGLIFSGVLFVKKQRSSNLLAGMLLVLSLAGLKLYGDTYNWFGSDFLRLAGAILPLSNVMMLGPLLYFYTRLVGDPTYKITKKQMRHFLLLVVDLVPCSIALAYLVLRFAGLIASRRQPWGDAIDSYNIYADIPRWVSLAAYVYAAWKHSPPSAWKRHLIAAFVAFLAIWLAYLIPYVIPRYTDTILNTLGWYPIYLPITVLIYWLSAKGCIITLGPKAMAKPEKDLEPGTIQQVTATLLLVMQEEKLYLDPQLDLSKLAKRTGFAARLLSMVINKHMNSNFNAFVNGYRVAAFKERVLQSESNLLTIAGLALECGFNSQATFQRAFKEMVGKSPSEYRRTARGS